MVAIIISLIALAFSIGAWIGYRLMWDKRDLTLHTETLIRVEKMLSRMELKTFVVAADLTRAQEIVNKVAADLAESQHRADQIRRGKPGEAADAGAQSGVDKPEQDKLF